MNVFNGYSLTWSKESGTGTLNGFTITEKPGFSFAFDSLDTVAMTKVVNGLTSDLQWSEIKEIAAYLEKTLGAVIRLPGISLATGEFVTSARVTELEAYTPVKPVSPNGEKWVWVDGAWADGRTTAELNEHLTEVKNAAKKKMAEMADKMAEQITGIVPMTEQLSWPVKETAAVAYQANAATQAQLALLAAEAQVTGEQVEDLVAKIVTNATAYHTAAGTIAGLRRKAAEVIDAATDTTGVAAALAGLIEQSEAAFAQLIAG